jgi:hypothetical protein
MGTYRVADIELYKETEARIKEKFRKGSLAHKTIMNGINPRGGTGSQPFFNTEMNSYLRKGQRVITLEDFEGGSSLGIVKDASGKVVNFGIMDMILRTKIDSFSKNKQILDYLVERVEQKGFSFSSEIPLRLSNLELIKDDNLENEYGLLFEIGKNTKIVSDSRFAYRNKNIQIGNLNLELSTRKTGLSKLYWWGPNQLISCESTFNISDKFDRIVIFEDD